MIGLIHFALKMAFGAIMLITVVGSSKAIANPAAEFKRLGKKMAKEASVPPIQYSEALDPDDLVKIVAEAKVSGVSRDLFVEINGQTKRVDAINYRNEKRIELDVRAWRRLNLKARQALVLHEYLGLLGIEKNTYEESSRLLSHLRRKKSRNRPEDACALEVLGTHAGSQCLWDFQDKLYEKRVKLEKQITALTVTRATDSVALREARAQSLDVLQNLKSGIDSRMRCSVEVADLEGNHRAYYSDLCEVRVLESYLKQLTELRAKMRRKFGTRH